MRERLDQLRIEQQDVERSKDKQQRATEIVTQELRGFQTQRQQDLREIEQANRAERERMLSDKEKLTDVADDTEDKERAKFDKLARKEKMPKEGQVILPAPVVAVPPPLPEKVKETPQPKPVVVKKTVVRHQEPAIDLEKFRREKKKIEHEDKRLREKDAALRKSLQREQEKAVSCLRAKEELLKKEEALIIVPKPVVSAQPVTVDQKSEIKKETPIVVKATAIAAEKDKTDLLTQAAIEERRMLAEQRSAIHKDFEAGVDRLYNDAVVLYQARQYEDAYEDFIQVNKMIKEYKKTAYYLKKINKMPKKNETRLLLQPVVVPKSKDETKKPEVPKPVEEPKPVDSYKPVMASPAQSAERSATVTNVLDLFDPNVNK